jgi:hypothetical protein
VIERPERRSGAIPAPPRPGSLPFRVQRAVLLELLVDPPPAGDPIAELPRRLGERPADVEAAVAALVRVGAAQAGAGFVRATAPSWYVAALELVRP